jgi:preprotein translocase subunit SecE
MAEETTPKKKTSPNEFFKQVRSETAKVVWPTREETVRTAIFVGILMLVLSLFFLGVDSLFSIIVNWLMTLA